MRIVFMGSAEFACPCLEQLLLAGADRLAGIVTQPDRPKGRSLRPAPCPVRARAAARGVPVLTPQDVNSADSLAAIRELAPELVVVVAYGQMLKPAILALPPQGCINIHASLLPKYRGAAPIQWAIARGEILTGVTAMFLNAAMDAGDIIDRLEEPIRADDTAGTLHDRLARRGAELLARVLEAIHRGQAARHPQHHAEASYAPKLKKSDGRLDWRRPAEELNNRVRGFNPWPGCFFTLPGAKPVAVRVLKAQVENGAEQAPAGIACGRPAEAAALQAGETVADRPGMVLEACGPGPLIATGRKALRLLEVQPEGRTSMSGAAFLCGHPLQVGDRLA